MSEFHLIEAQKSALIKELIERLDQVVAERDKYKAALESDVRGFDVMRRIIIEGRSANSKLDDIRIALINQRAETITALQEAGDD